MPECRTRAQRAWGGGWLGQTQATRAFFRALRLPESPSSPSRQGRLPTLDHRAPPCLRASVLNLFSALSDSVAGVK